MWPGIKEISKIYIEIMQENKTMTLTEKQNKIIKLNYRWDTK